MRRNSDTPPLKNANNSLKLIVFSDDWGRHPSSCQHLVRHLLEDQPTLWVDTIGTRRPSLRRDDLRRVATKVLSWCRPATPTTELPCNLTVIRPVMWPGFRRPWQRVWNAGQMARAVARALGPRQSGERRVVLTTIVITADLIRTYPQQKRTLDADGWVYYCVDDFSVWPGLDSEVLEAMENEQVAKVDQVVTASQELGRRLEMLGRDSHLLTHGIDLEHWEPGANSTASPHVEDEESEGSASAWHDLERPLGLFWGLIDRRLDVDWLKALVESKALGSLVLVGPQQDPDPRLLQLPRTTFTGSLSYGLLPACARQADVLLMPYADLPVTRAMQPLKFLEYLATGKPVVARALPSNREWADAADLAEDPDTFIRAIRHRLEAGTSTEQIAARRRLQKETWQKKAAQLAAWIADTAETPS